MSDLLPPGAGLSVKKQALLEVLLKKKSKGYDTFPLSFAQERLWFLHQWDAHSSLYTIFLPLRLTGQLQLAALQQSIAGLVRRHEILRTTFVAPTGQPLQVIAPAGSWPLPLLDLSALTGAEDEEAAHLLARTESQQPFDLSQGPLMRTWLLRLGACEHALLLTLHHIVADGWSMGIVLRELAVCYRAACAGQKASLPALPIQYADFALWQRQWLQGALRERQVTYWQQQLAGAPAVLHLPVDRPRPAVQRARAGHQHLVLPQRLTEALRALGRAQEATLFMTLLATLQILLYRLSGQSDVLVGTPVANRNRPELEGLLGFFVNMLVLRTSMAGEPGFRQVLARTRETCLGAYAHQDLPFEQLVEVLRLPRDLSHTPLFQVVFQLQHSSEPVELPGVTISSFKTAPALAKFDLNITLAEDAGGLSGVLEYNADLFAAQSISRLLGSWQTLLAGIVADPEASIERLPLLTAAQYHQQVVTWNRTDCHDGALLPVHLLVAEQVERAPERVAVVCEEEHLTYQMLNQQAERLALALRAQGVATEHLVALLDARGSALLIAILAVWKAGGAYLALDPQDPPARLRQLLVNSRAPFVLSGPRFAPLLQEVLRPLPPESVPCVLQQTASAGNSALPGPGLLSQLAYVMYTSGSTGAPKGAMLEVRGMLNHLYAKIRGLALTASDRVAHTASQCFDISVWQFLAPLLVGGQVQIFADAVVRDPGRQLAAFEEAGITVFESAPSLLAVMLSAVEAEGARRPFLRSVHGHICSGETLPPDLCRRWLACYAHIPIVNTYGATECSDDVTFYRVCYPPAASTLRTPVGRPLGNLRQYVLDRHLQPVPAGVAGEIYLGGPGVGRGYLDDPWRTAEVFLADPFSDEPGARFYRTGDLGRVLSDGTLDFLGRQDQQVKVRGLRIELEEIARALREHPLVREAIVLAHQEAELERELVAYVVAAGPQTPTAGELRRFLQARLPEYMLPGFWLALDALPLNANGKIERRALPAPREARAPGKAFVAPRTPLEEKLAEVWGQTLSLTRIGVFEDFFEIGGHSLLATRLLSRLRTTFGVECSLRLIFEAPTISAQAEALAHLLAEQVDSALLRALEDLPPDDLSSASTPGGERR